MQVYFSFAVTAGTWSHHSWCLLCICCGWKTVTVHLFGRTKLLFKETWRVCLVSLSAPCPVCMFACLQVLLAFTVIYSWEITAHITAFYFHGETFSRLLNQVDVTPNIWIKIENSSRVSENIDISRCLLSHR